MNTFKLLDDFTDYTFEEKSHTYTYKGTKVGSSVTQLIGNYVKPFEKDFWAAKKAKQRGVDKQVVLDEWKFKADCSSTAGTIFHSYMEHMLAGKIIDVHERAAQEEPSIQEIINPRLDQLLPLGQRFIEESRHKLIPIRSELTVGIEDKVAGQIDQLFYNERAGKIEVWDWKTNKAINTKNGYGERLLNPLGHLEACEYTEYSLQLNIYKAILIRHGFDIGNCYFVWFNENNESYLCYQCAELQTEAEMLLFRV